MRTLFAAVLVALCAGVCPAGEPFFARGPRTSAETFFAQCVDTSAPALAGIPARMAAGDVAGAEKLFADHVRATLRPEIYLRAERAAKPEGKTLRSLAASAAEIMDYKLRSCSLTHHFADHRVDWDINPTYNGYREWTWQLSRHPFFTTLARYYLATGDERATETWMAMLGSWFDQATLPPDGTSGYDTHCWRNIEAGIRMPEWAFQIHAFLKSPKLSDHFLTAFFRSVWEHGHRVTDVRTFANWRQHELMGLLYIGELYPFLKDAPAWRDYALQELETTFAEQIYPDGFQYELTTGYHCAVISNYRSVMAVYDRFGRPAPDFFRKNLENMYAMVMPLTLPLGNTPALNDGGKIYTAKFLRAVLADYPHRADFRWFATHGTEGSGPDYLSTYLPYAGAVTFRSSWREDAVGAYMDCSPFGSNHQHEDKLNFVLQAYGKDMLVEAGSYAYDTSDMRRYVIETRSHNTIRIDGQEQRARNTYKWLSGMISNQADLVFGTAPDRDWCGAAFTDGYGARGRQAKLDRTVHRRTAVFHKDVPSAGPFFVIVDRLEAPDARKRSWEAIWHVEESAFRIDGSVFTADFGGGVGLVGAVSDAAAKIVDRKGQKEPYFQGWMPIHKPGPHEHRPVPTPVVEGRFAGAHRVVTVLAPYRKDLVKVAGVTASADVKDRSYTVRFADGSEKTWTEP